jgi:hypothetical protein
MIEPAAQRYPRCSVRCRQRIFVFGHSSLKKKVEILICI